MSKSWPFFVSIILGVAVAVGAEAACDCTVTDASGAAADKSSKCTLANLLATPAECPTIQIASKIETIAPQYQVHLGVDRQIVGHGKFRLVGSSLPGNVGTLILIDGDKTNTAPNMFNITTEATNKTAIRVQGAHHVLEWVAITNSSVGVDDGGTATQITENIFSGNDVGVLLQGTQGNVAGNSFENSKVTAIRSIAAAQKNTFDQNTFLGNAAAIVLEEGSNSNIPAPTVMRTIHPKGDTQHQTLLVIGFGGAIVRAYEADSASAPQGKKPLAVSNIVPTSGLDLLFSDIYRIDVSGVASDLELVLIANTKDIGSTAFSQKFKLSSKMDVASDNCLEAQWFLVALEKLHGNNSDKSVWTYDSDDDGKLNGEEDLNRNCKVDKGETAPNKFDLHIKPMDIICALNPAACQMADTCAKNPELCQYLAAGDADKDGIGNDKDNCPDLNKEQTDQTDTDGDGIGDLCDKDDDNDGLTDEQEASGSPAVLSFLNTVVLDPQDADSDGDGYCDGPGSGPVDVKTQTILVCAKGPGDNCPRQSNSDQWDDDEDGIGNACDKSPWAIQGGAKSLVDSDYDGKLDFQDNGLGDNCPGIANPADANGQQLDTDGDGSGDACDSDDDNDGLLDVVENSTRYALDGQKGKTWRMLNALSPETDDPKDGKNDGACDGEGPGFKESNICGATPVKDECPVIYGPKTKEACGSNTDLHVVYPNDIDGDGIANDQDDCVSVKNMGIKSTAGKDIACDTDIDGDGVKNWDEDKLRTHYWEKDSDHYKEPNGKVDGKNDKEDICPVNFNPVDASGKQPDICHDKVSDLDSDGDGIPDAKDNCPLIANADQTNTDKKLVSQGVKTIGDELGDLCDPDIDGDGILNEADKKCPKDPTNACLDINPPPPPPPPGTGVPPSSIQGGAGCALIASDHAMPTSAATVFAMLALLPLGALRLRRHH